MINPELSQCSDKESSYNEELKGNNIVSPERGRGQFSLGIARDNASTPTYENVSGSNSTGNRSADLSGLSDRVGVAGVSRVAGPMKRIASELQRLGGLRGELGEDQSLCEILQGIKKGIEEAVYNLVGQVEELVVSGEKFTAKNELGSCDQLTLMSKRESEVQNGANTYLDLEYHKLYEQTSLLEGDNCRLSNEKDRIIKKNGQLEEDLSTLEQRLSETSQKLKNTEDQLKKTKRELDDAKEDVSQLKRDVSDGQTKINDLIVRISELTEKKDQLKGELDRTGTEFKEKEKALNAANGKVSKLEQDLKQKNQKIVDLDDQAAQLARQNDQLERRLNDAEQRLEKQAEKLKNTQAQLTERIDEINKARDQLNELVAEDPQGLISKFTLANEKEVLSGEVTRLAEENTRLQSEVVTLTEQNGQLEKELKITREKRYSTKQELAKVTKENEQLRAAQNQSAQEIKILTNQVARLNDSKSSLKNQLEGQLKGMQGQLTDKKGEISSIKDQITQLAKEKGQLAERLNGVQQSPNPGNESRKFLAVSAQGRKQVTYASVSFVLSGAFAVGASLTIPYLAICITLAVAALTFLVVGCYCSYKANTALSNVEVDHCVNPAVVEV